MQVPDIGMRDICRGRRGRTMACGTVTDKAELAISGRVAQGMDR